MRSLSAALAFLTRLPTARAVPHDIDDLGRSTPYFPVVGLFVGGAGAAVFWATSFVWPTLLAILVSVAATVLLSGAFHEDALADAFDGFGGGWNAEQVLAIMKDSRVGAYALIGVLLVMGAKIAALHAIAGGAANGVDDFSGTNSVMRSLLAAHVLGRWSSVPLMRYCSYVRPAASAERPGTVSPFVDSVTTPHFAISTFAAATIVAATLGARSFVVWPAAVLVTLVAARYFNERIGGITGDALGATNQFVEVATYLVLAAHLRP
jgi:adenosylcobinamide-GDP ribazoletransferase